MSLTSLLMLKLGPAIAKAVLKVLLDDYKFLGELAPDLLDMLQDRAAEEHGPRDDAQRIAEIGVRVAQRVHPLLIAEAGRLPPGELAALVAELTATLGAAEISAKMVVSFDLDADRLADYLVASRPTATRDLSAGATALYERLLAQAASAIITEARSLADYERTRDAALLATAAQTRAGVASLLDRSLTEAERFEDAYRAVVGAELEKIEIFGVPVVDEKMRRQEVSVAYIMPDVEPANLERADKADGAVLLEEPVEAREPRRLDDPLPRHAGPVSRMLASARRFVISGEAGSGKTTLAQWISLRSARGDFPSELAGWNDTVPFFIRLRALKSAGDERGFPALEELPDLVAQGMAGAPPPNWVRDQLQAGRAIVLVDGVDELPEAQRGQMLAGLKTLLRLAPAARYIITSRPLRVKEQPWQEWEDWLNREGFARARLLDMTQENIDRFIDHWHEALIRCSGPANHADLRQLALLLKELLRQRPALRRLATNPLLCAMICALHHDRRDNLPGERVELYNACVETLLLRDSGRKIALAGEFPILTPEQKRRLIQEFAYALSRGGGLDLGREDADQHFAYELAQMDVPPGTDGHQVCELFIRRVRLLHEPVTGRVEFVHRTFQEFLTARASVQSSAIDELLGHADDDQWRETIVLAAGMTNARQSERLLRGLLDGAGAHQRAGDLRGRRRRPAPPSDPEAHVRRLTLALACLETCVQRPPELPTKVLHAAAPLFPPKSDEEAKLLAVAGPAAVPLLRADTRYTEKEAAACVLTLGLIGGSAALEALADYAEDERAGVIFALGAVWENFDHRTYTQKVLARMRRLILRSFTYWDGFDVLVNLAALDLSSTGVSDLTPLQHLVNLTTLDLSGTPTSDLTPLQHLVNLTTLYLSDTPVGDLAPLQHLANLTRLDIENTHVSDLIPLQHLGGLAELNISGTPIVDLDPLAHMACLRRLGVRVSSLRDTGTLMGLRSMEIVDTEKGIWRWRDL